MARTHHRPRTATLARTGLAALLLAGGPALAAHPDYRRAFRDAGCPVPAVKAVKRITEPSGHEGHADVTVYEATCPGGRSVSVTCLPSGCRADRPTPGEGDR